MKEENEIRVRAVTRYVVTIYRSRTNENSGRVGVETIGEFNNINFANRVGRALHETEPSSTFVAAESVDPCGVYYAANSAQNDALMKLIHSPDFPPG